MFATLSQLKSIVACSVLLVAGSSQAAILEMIDEGGSGPVKVFTDIASSESETTFSNGTTHFTAVLAVNALPSSVAVGQRSVALVAPGGQPDAPITDLITFTADEPFSAPIIHIPFQKITVDFTPGRFGPISAPAGVIFIPRTGELPALSDALHTSPFLFAVQSAGGAAVPEPSLVWLLAGGLVAFGMYRQSARIRAVGV